jgi:SWIB/MDM2 domain
MSSSSSSTSNKMPAPAASAAKKSNAKATKAPVAAPVAVPPPAPVVQHTPAAHAKASAAAPAPVSAPAPVAVAAPVVAEADAEESVVTNFAALLVKFNALRTSLNELAPEMKKMEKQVARLEKKAERRRRRKTGVVGADGEKKPNPTTVFTKPVEITKELCVFLKLAPGTQVSRSDVTRGVMKYAKDNQLTDKQTIKPDATLRKLLGLTEQDNLTILNLQKYLKGHYVKAVVPTA